MSEVIVNKVAESGLISLDLESYYPRQEIAVFDQAVGAGGHQGGDRQKKRKLGGGLAIEAQPHGTDDGRARSAHARHQGRALNQAHFQRIAPAHGVHIGNRAARAKTLPTLDPQNHQTARDKAKRHHRGGKKNALNEFKKQRPSHSRRKKANDDITCVGFFIVSK